MFLGFFVNDLALKLGENFEFTDIIRMFESFFPLSIKTPNSFFLNNRIPIFGTH